MLDVIIRGAEICDGTGAPRRAGDIAIDGGRIVDVGTVAAQARREIRADGLIAAPGFIDVHTHYDCQVSWDPALTPSSWHGVTSVVMGNCGFSIAPCRPEQRELLAQHEYLIFPITSGREPRKRARKRRIVPTGGEPGAVMQ